MEINYKKTQVFFEQPGKNGKQLENKYNYVLFQDAHPQLALKRGPERKTEEELSLSFGRMKYENRRYRKNRTGSWMWSWSMEGRIAKT